MAGPNNGTGGDQGRSAVVTRLPMAVSRVATAFGLGLLLALPAGAETGARHGASVFGSLKYGPDFRHFDYVDPDAPKGGLLKLRSVGTFDNVQPFILKGREGVGIGSLVHDTLMVRAADEPDAHYGLIAESVELADDGAMVIFNLRPEARFHDASPITAADVVFSFEALTKQGHPSWRIRYQNVAGAAAPAPHRVEFALGPGATRDLPVKLALLPVLSRAYYATRDFATTTLEPPLASGPYRIAKVDAPRQITYRRVADYWARDLPVNRGRWNFDTIRFDYYRDRTSALLAFFAGEYSFREEFTSKSWSTEYDDKIPIQEGLIVRDVLTDHSPSGVQAWFYNMRRPKFADRRVRAALDLAFDYEWTNKNIFYGLYDRTTSMFENSELAQSGPPDAIELALLEPFRGQIPEQVFEVAFQPPRTDGSGNNRPNLRAARTLLAEAGWRIAAGKLVDDAGTPMKIEFLIFQPTFERVIGPYKKNLERLGIAVTIRRVDPAQYVERVKSFDYDVITARYVMPETPGVELLNYFSSANADVVGSLNRAGIKDPVVDALIDRILQSPDRAALVAATRALDRVLMWNRYAVPQWFKGTHHIAYWNRYSRPAIKPSYARGVLDTWWYDPAKAALTDAGKPVPKD